MIHHIDIGSVLRGTVCELYSNLVTRPTGAAVRCEIERALAELGGQPLAVIDFSQVTLLDFSCADEIVAKLMLRAVAHESDGGTEGYFVFRGLGDSHLDAIEAVLERHGLAIVALVDGEPSLLGEVPPAERELWELVRQLGRATVASVAAARGAHGVDATARTSADELALLERLHSRRLLMRLADDYVAVGAALGAAA